MNDKSGNQEWGREWGKEMARSEHEQTYDAFISYGKWATVFVIGILLFLLIFIY